MKKTFLFLSVGVIVSIAFASCSNGEGDPYKPDQSPTKTKVDTIVKTIPPIKK